MTALGNRTARGSFKSWQTGWKHGLGTNKSGPVSSLRVTQLSVAASLPTITPNYTVTANVSASNLQVLNVTAASAAQMVFYSFVTGTGLSTGQKIVSQVLPLIGGEANGGIGRYNLLFPETAAVASTSIGVTSFGFYDFHLDPVRKLLHASTGQRGGIMTYDVSNTDIAPVFVGESVRLNVGVQGNSRYLTAGPTADTLYLCTTTGSYLSKFDLSGGGVPALVSNFQDTTNLKNISDVKFVGTTAFALCYDNSAPTSGVGRLTSLDCSSWPPTVIQSITSSSLRFISQLEIVGNYAVACGPWSGSASAVVVTIDISNPAAMVIADTSAFLNRALSLEVVDNYIYTTSESTDFTKGYLETYSINPATGQLTHVGTIQAAYADNIQYDGGNYLFLGGGPKLEAFDHRAVLFVDISVRSQPKLVYQSPSTYVEPRAFTPGFSAGSIYFGQDLGNAIHAASLG